MKWQLLIEVNINDSQKLEAFNLLLPAVQKFGESISPKANAEIANISFVGNEKKLLLEIGKVKLDIQNRILMVNDSEITITPIEFKLLYTLMCRRGQVQDRGVLLSDVWGMSPNSNTRTVDVHIKRLRDKLGPGNNIIHTISGMGYIIH